MIIIYEYMNTYHMTKKKTVEDTLKKHAQVSTSSWPYSLSVNSDLKIFINRRRCKTQTEKNYATIRKWAF